MRNPLASFVRGRLQRRMFLWFGFAIVATIATTFTVNQLLGGGFGATWQREVARVRSLVGDRFSRTWDDPPARDELARAMARELEVDVTLVDVRGRVLTQTGPRCRHPVFADVRREGAVVGRVEACAERTRSGALWRNALALAAACVVLWLASGAVAHRLSRPLIELARVAGDLGRGKLQSRVRLGRHAHGEVGVLAEVLNEMATRIEKQMADQRALLATVSHEIRTPLARMRLLTELGRTDPAALDQIDREVSEIDELVAELLASSRLEFAALTLKDLDLVELLTRAVERAEVDPAVLSVETDVKTFRGDATLLSRALVNLLVNAKRHGGGVTALRITSRSGKLSFEVDDEGPGIAPGDETRLFEPFYRGPSSDARSVGLGLALVKRIAEAHGGTAYARSRDPQQAQEGRQGGGARVGFEISSG